MIASARVITVVGIGAEGWDGVSEVGRAWVERARVVLGGRRHLDLLPDVPGQRREPWPSPLRDRLPALLASLADEAAGGHVVALASGDPLVSGIATTFMDLLGPDEVTVVPGISSVALARAAMRWSAESHAVVSVVGRDVALVRRELAPGRRILVLSSDEHTPRDVAALLVAEGYGDSELTVLGDLGEREQSSFLFDKAVILTGKEFDLPRLNVVAIDCVGPSLGGWVAGLPDDAFEHDGQLTKRDLRASALARLSPTPGEHLWDVGAGAGSVGIEWMRAHPSCTTTAVEADADRAARISRNATSLGVPGLEVVHGRAPGALAGLRPPDAIFVGGGATRDGVIDACLTALRPAGRLVVHGVTLETEMLLGRLYREHGGELTRVSVETSAPVGAFTGWTPARTVTQWALSR
ncbi:precorrin-6Y C5,15-methyltransferase [Tessaracoccus lapidicaptus]|uniref:Precorrin-6Y C5,15-methyltransferase n=1 Tax=Tessaracoccus lapidicaptus TaxID=1427523 RepID=A0A1C0AN17_9ACTN|nr:cobalamin biosynthesis bifunctional protein CbiET [Tessaracoccus sp. T2.5-30]OCL34562.1 precorrin-6Y C5,15-methyltransferase [Tessaracoccus lapidicaptus]VEP38879.1 Precorrin-6Y C(5,15)-methyltransferase [decarboxylating] [Tessaracoccus lapidicaptus]